MRVLFAHPVEQAVAKRLHTRDELRKQGLALFREQQATLTSRQNFTKNPTFSFESDGDVGGRRGVQPNPLRQCYLVKPRELLKHPEYRVLDGSDFATQEFMKHRHGNLMGATYQVTRLVIQVEAYRRISSGR